MTTADNDGKFGRNFDTLAIHAAFAVRSGDQATALIGAASAAGYDIRSSSW